ncbi:inverse autotransporter beta domain-containing protein [Alphaproteobacteria bacterium]|nr:inverse autotransporter beta domain-containing protein [Alphaproteobacteria bacterium]
MKKTNLFFVSLIIIPMTILDVSAAGNSTDELKSTVMDKTLQVFEDGFNSLFSNTELTIEGRTKSDPNFTLLTIQPISESEDKKDLTFFQGSILRQNNRDTINLGIGYRQLSDDEKWIYGVNAFHDYDNTYEHSRMSLGAELRSSAFEINANKYFATSGAKTGKDGNTERALDGYELEVGGQVPYIPSAKVFVKNWKWDGYQTSDTKGNTYSIQINAPIAPNITLEAGTKDFDTGTDIDFVNLTYKIGLGGGKSQQDELVQNLIAEQAFNNTSMKKKMLDKVRRKNQIVIQTGFTASAGGV